MIKADRNMKGVVYQLTANLSLMKRMARRGAARSLDGCVSCVVGDSIVSMMCLSTDDTPP